VSRAEAEEGENDSKKTHKSHLLGRREKPHRYCVQFSQPVGRMRAQGDEDVGMGSLAIRQQVVVNGERTAKRENDGTFAYEQSIEEKSLSDDETSRFDGEKERGRITNLSFRLVILGGLMIQT